MLSGPLLNLLATSWIAVLVKRDEAQVVYPFDPVRTAPMDAGLIGFSELEFAASDGTELVVWTHPPASGQPVILYLPGNAGTLAGRATRFQTIAHMGYGLVTMAYRGSSGSGGSPDENLLTADAIALAERLALIAPGAPVVLYGESLGSALAVRIAAAETVSGIVLEAPFTTFPEIVAAQFPRETGLAEMFTQIWDNRALIGKVTEPLLILHGTGDRMVPFEQGEELLARAGSTNKSLFAITDARHDEMWTPATQQALYHFLDSL
ncbi:MAG: alpha/beta hydrolase [Rhodobacteraceae bacterium]|nr:alpha/beta hydrolase [Paracoccaceae bacterium]